MKTLACVLMAGTLLSAAPAFACSPTELTQKQKAFSSAVKAAFDRDPSGDAGRQVQAQTIIARYKGLNDRMNGGYLIDMLCKENDELLAVYK
jgi:hypothetical protein